MTRNIRPIYRFTTPTKENMVSAPRTQKEGHWLK